MTTSDLNISIIKNSVIPVDFTFDALGTLTGNRKLAQTWIRLFLTDTGSQQYHPETGSGFLNIIRTGRIRKNADVGLNFKIAADTVARNLTSDPETADLPETEQLAFATLESYLLDFEESRLQLRVKLTPIEGDSITFSVPVAV